MKGQVILITGALAGIGRATAVAAATKGTKLSSLAATPRPERHWRRSFVLLAQRPLHQSGRPRRERSPGLGRRGGRPLRPPRRRGQQRRDRGKPGPVVDQTPEAYAATFDTNVLGVLLCMKHEFRVMQSQGSGSIVNISSTMGSRGAANASLYVASKHAVEGLTKSGALEAALRCPRQCGGTRPG